MNSCNNNSSYLLMLRKSHFFVKFKQSVIHNINLIQTFLQSALGTKSNFFCPYVMHEDKRMENLYRWQLKGNITCSKSCREITCDCTVYLRVLF